MKYTLKKLFIVFFITSSFAVCPAEIIYVDCNAAGANDGSSWINAYNFLQDALADANTSPKPVEIRVAQGAYTPDSNYLYPNGTGDRSASFYMITNVAVKGGYAGISNPDPNARDFQLYETVLSGDLAGNDIDVNDPCDLLFHPTRLDNSYHVVQAKDVNDTTLDGFSIISGNADYVSCNPWVYGGCGINGEGGGLFVYASGQVSQTVIKFCKLSISNCCFFKNSASFGAGICNIDGDVWINNCNFNSNFSLRSGAGISSIGGKSYIKNNQKIYLVGLTVSKCNFYQNDASYAGSGIYNNKSDSIITDCEFFENVSGYHGGAMANYYSGVTVTECRFTDNYSFYSGGGVTNYVNCCELYCCPTPAPCEICKRPLPKFVNCIFSGNMTGGSGGAMENLCSDPNIINCTFYANIAGSLGGGIYNWKGLPQGYANPYPCTIIRPHLLNCILWGNIDSSGNNEFSQIHGGSPVINYSCIYEWSGIFGGTGNTGENPLFTDPNNYDFHLKSQAGRWDPNTQGWVLDNVTSPCIDAGDWMTPIGLEPFPNGGRVNMGACGGTEQASKSYFGKEPCKTIIAGDINGDCIVDLKDFSIMALHWLEES